MAGRFSARRFAAAEPLPAVQERSPDRISPAALTEVAPEAAPPAAPPSPLLSDKLLDAKVRLHRKLI